MGNFATYLNIQNSSGHHANVVVMSNQPGGHHDGRYYEPRSEVFQASIPNGGYATMEIRRHCHGAVHAEAIVTLGDGAVVAFPFEVYERDCNDTIVLFHDFVTYNGQQRGQLRGGGGFQPGYGGGHHSSHHGHHGHHGGGFAPQPQYPQPGYPQPSFPPPQPGYPQPGYPQPGYPSPQPGYPQPGYPQPGYPQPGYPPAQPGYGGIFSNGQRVLLQSVASGRNLRLEDGWVNGNGGQGPFAHWIVSYAADGNVRFQNQHNPSHYLAIRDGQLTYGEGGPFCEFIVHQHGGNIVSLRSAQGQGAVGIFEDGNPKPPYEVGEGTHAQFMVIYA